MTLEILVLELHTILVYPECLGQKRGHAATPVVVSLAESAAPKNDLVSDKIR